ncbi:hypothetical protein BAL199_22307 [alpha proteobacterium BAL199]|nr:hypothetical protein BAL199_22307 [alpha proteobacterium BAL199]
MMKRLLATLVILTGLIGSGGDVWADDFKEGVKAYNSGDFKTALRKWKPLAEQGDAYAQFNIGLMYKMGDGVTQDNAEALKWYRKAAEQGHAAAQNNLGGMYERGVGVTKDYAEAVKWYRKAAEQGYVFAQFNIGLMYKRGDGVLQDTIAAHMWFNIAAANGNNAAVKNRDTVAEELTKADIFEAQKRAKRCVASGYKDCY